MGIIRIKDKKFSTFITSDKIKSQTARVAQEINRDFAGSTPVFVAILNGSFMFAADLLREISLPCEIHFVKLASYTGTKSTGSVHEMIGLHADLRGRDVIIIEDIVDSGLTMQFVTKMLAERSPRSVSICTLLLKPGNLQVNLDIKYKCFDIPNDFIVGCGLDYDGFGRNLKDIYTVTN